MKVKLTTFACLRCGHKWHPKQEKVPVRCAFCKTPYWNTESRLGTSEVAGRHDKECAGCREA